MQAQPSHLRIDWAFVIPAGGRMIKPADMSLDELDAAMTRLSVEYRKAGPQRQRVILRVCDSVLDEVLVRRAYGPVEV